MTAAAAAGSEPRVAVIGDTHLKHGHPRNADRLAAFDEAIAAAETHAPLAAWVHLGDVFHEHSTPQDRLEAALRFQRMADTAPVVVVGGNHGAPLDTELLARLQSRHPIHAVTSPQVVNIVRGADVLVVAVIPYPSRAALVAAGVSREQQARVAHEAFDLLALDTASQWSGRLGPRMVVGHVTIAGAVTSVGQPMVGVELEMDAATLARYGDVPKLFGHIHKHQQVADATYVGSCCRMDWGETEPKGWMLVEFTRVEAGAPLRSAWSHACTFMPLHVAPMYHVEGTLMRERFDWKVRKGPDGPRDQPPTSECAHCHGTGDGAHSPTESTLSCEGCYGSGNVVDWTGCDVRVRARYAEAERALLSAAQDRISREFPGARRLHIEMVAVQQRQLRAPEVAAAVTLPEKLQAWARLSGVAWSDEIGRCAQQLLATEDGDAVVAETRARLEEAGRAE